MKIFTTAFYGLFVCLVFSSFSTKNKWIDLLDKDLSQWEMFLSYRHSVNFNGSVPKDERGEEIKPVGYGKNESNVFSVIQENGKPVLRISGEIYGCLFTKQEFANYHLKLKVKWGEKKWIPRLDKLKDSGICYHSIGPCGPDYWRSWMLSQEFQIMEGHMGDYWTIANSAIDVRAFIPEGNMNTVADVGQPFLPIGAGTSLPGFCMRSVNHESPENEWTDIDLVCFEGKSLHIVNGEVVMALQNSRYRDADGGKLVPLTQGKIQLQSEAAEVFYKDIRIQMLDKLPGKYAKYFE